MVDIFDKDMNHIGIMEKQEAQCKCQWHKAVHIWVTDGKNVLVQLRSPNAKSFPNFRDISVAGHLQTGETPLDGAKREWGEEFGIVWDLGEIKQDYIFKYEKYNNGQPVNKFIYIYFVNKKIDLPKLRLQAEEVSRVEYIPYNKFVELFSSNKFIPNTVEYENIVKQGLLKLMK